MKMLSSNASVLQEILSDRRYRQFIIELDELFRKDPEYTARRLNTIFEGAARGERIMRFEDRYVISSFLPPVPSRAFFTFVRGGLSEDSLFHDLAYARRSAPLSAHLCVTKRCPYRCEHCGQTVLDDDVELTTAEWIKVIRDLQDLGVAYIAFSGGEPLIRDDLLEIVAAVDDRACTLLFTNGKGLTSEMAAALKRAGLFILAVSIDSADAEVHNRIRRNPNAFSHALTAVGNAVEAGLYTLVSAVVYRKDLSRENLFRLFALAREHGAHEVRVHQAIPRGRLSDIPNADEIFLTEEDIERLSEIQFEANERADEFPKVSSFAYAEGPCKFGCCCGGLHSYIASDGDLWPCDFVPFSFGNVLENDLKEIYARMNAAAGSPKTSCFARAIAEHLRDKELPLSAEEGEQLYRRCNSTPYPRFFADLQPPESKDA